MDNIDDAAAHEGAEVVAHVEYAPACLNAGEFGVVDDGLNEAGEEVAFGEEVGVEDEQVVAGGVG